MPKWAVCCAPPKSYMQCVTSSANCLVYHSFLTQSVRPTNSLKTASIMLTVYELDCVYDANQCSITSVWHIPLSYDIIGILHHSTNSMYLNTTLQVVS